MGPSLSHVKSETPGLLKNDETNLIITGLGSEWPPKLIGPNELREYALKFYPKDTDWLMSLLKINEQTGIDSRAVIDIWDDPKWHLTTPPTVDDVDAAFRRYGIPLAKNAALKALNDANIEPAAITHMVGVTATNAGCPGYDQLVARELGLPESAEKVLISGAGCAGGLAALRVASNLALASSFRGHEARILVVACEICSAQVRAELHASAQSGPVGIGPALFGDGASALVLCNPNAVKESTPKRFSLIDWRTHTTPKTESEMSYNVTSHGFCLSLSKRVPALVAASVEAPFQSLTREQSIASLSPSDFDWALHPGGSAIIKGVQMSMNLPECALVATNEIYKSRGNTSSVAVLAVLDRLRTVENGKQDVIACSFGPGLTVEMALLKRLL